VSQPPAAPAVLRRALGHPCATPPSAPPRGAQRSSGAHPCASPPRAHAVFRQWPTTRPRSGRVSRIWISPSVTPGVTLKGYGNSAILTKSLILLVGAQGLEPWTR